jgi:hypothetical protein
MSPEPAVARLNEEVPTGLIRLRDGRLVPRRYGWLEPGESIRCPFNHRVNPAGNLHEGAITTECKFRDDDKFRPERGAGVRSAPCGAKFYVSTGAQGFFWADITEEEDHEIKSQGIRPVNVARYLGIHFPK